MKFRILKIYIILRNMLRMNHWRGHGIHSPFMYDLVRNVIVKRRVSYNENSLPRNIINYNLLKRDTLFIKNLYAYLGYTECMIVGEGEPADRTFCIAPKGTPAEAIEQLIRDIETKGCNECCVAVLGVNKSAEKYRLCRAVVKSHTCVSVDIYRTYLFFYDNKLQKQYYRIRSRYGDPIINTLPARMLNRD